MILDIFEIDSNTFSKEASTLEETDFLAWLEKLSPSYNIDKKEALNLEIL
jgi:hypothetical protein